ncbi:MAG: hypothetical protein ACFE0Q_14515 [Anaerolineae bacterium]
MAELPLDLKKLETVRGAFEILKYLHARPDNAADGDNIMDDLDLSNRRFDKAKRRLVTRNYIQMRSDYTYELTRKGLESAEALIEFDRNTDDEDDEEGITRQLAVVVPRNFVYGHTSSLKIGIAPHPDVTQRTDLIVRVTPTHAQLGDYNEMATLDGNALILETTITPEAYTKARIKVEVYQMENDTFADLGGLYLDVVVVESGDSGDDFAYTTDLNFVS